MQKLKPTKYVQKLPYIADFQVLIDGFYRNSLTHQKKYATYPYNICMNTDTFMHYIHIIYLFVIQLRFKKNHFLRV